VSSLAYPLQTATMCIRFRCDAEQLRYSRWSPVVSKGDNVRLSPVGPLPTNDGDSTPNSSPSASSPTPSFAASSLPQNHIATEPLSVTTSLVRQLNFIQHVPHVIKALFDVAQRQVPELVALPTEDCIHLCNNR
jgi:hypothetical protein